MKTSKIGVVGCLLAVVLVSNGFALTLSAVSGTWSNPQGGAAVAYEFDQPTAYGNTKEDLIRWGYSSGYGKSGLGFTGVGTPLLFNTEEAFEIGQLRHINMPISSGSAIDSALLTLYMQFSDPAGWDKNFAFTFNVNETPNSYNPATNPKNNDFIYFPNSYATESYVLGDTTYTLQLLGFGVTSGSLVSQLESVETLGASSKLWGRITSTTNSVPDGGTTVMLLGLAGIGLATMKRFVRG